MRTHKQILIVLVILFLFIPLAIQAEGDTNIGKNANSPFSQ